MTIISLHILGIWFQNRYQNALREEDVHMFVAPEMKVVEFDITDVITTSCTEDCPEFCGDQLPPF